MLYSAHDILQLLQETREIVTTLDAKVDHHNPVADLRDLGEEYFPRYVDKVADVASRIDGAIDTVAELAGGGAQ